MAKAVKKATKKSSKRAEPQAKSANAAVKKTTPTKSRAAKAKPIKESEKASKRAKATTAPVTKKTASVAVKPKKAAAKKSSTKGKTASVPVKRSTGKVAAKKASAKPTDVKAAKSSKKPANGKLPKLNVDEVIKEFRSVVNLKADQLERWLSLPDSKKLGFKDEVKEGTVGHESGRRILKILSKRRDKYTDDDLRHMQTVVGFVRRHRKEKPPGDVFASNWRYSLMNWGHDPMK
jgi:hypothetical protein